MREEISHPRFLELLEEDDVNLLNTDLETLKQRLANASTFKDEGLWSDDLVTYIENAGLPHFIHFHWIAERHYAQKLRTPELLRVFDHYYLIGYARIIALMMRYHVDMGHDNEDFFFVSGFLSSRYGADKQIRILEIGIGAGKLFQDLISIDYTNLEGVEMTPSAMRLARASLEPTLGTDRLHEMTFEDFCRQFPDKRYDVIIHSNLIEHIPSHMMAKFLSNIRALLKPQGYMITITPHRLSGPHDITREFRVGGSAAEGFHLWEFTLHDLDDVLTKAGFSHLMAVQSLPSLNAFWDSVPNETSFRMKKDMEQFLSMMDWKLRKPIIDGMYFKGVICQKVER